MREVRRYRHEDQRARSATRSDRETAGARRGPPRVVRRARGDGEGPRAASRGGGGAVGLGAARGTHDPPPPLPPAERAITPPTDEPGRGGPPPGRPRRA